MTNPAAFFDKRLTADVAGLPVPGVVESLDYEVILAAIQADFQARYPDFSAALESEPVLKLMEAVAYRELLLRQRVNDSAQALFASTAVGSDLDALAAGQGIVRAVVKAAQGVDPAVLETDAQLLNRYLLSFSRYSAGSRGALAFWAYSAAPDLTDAAVIGPSVHGRDGDVDLVVLGAGYEDALGAAIDAIRDAAFGGGAYPDGLGGFVVRADRVEYDVHLRVTPAATDGPSRELARIEAERRVRSVCVARQRIGAAVPPALLQGAAYGDGVSIVSVEDLAPVALAAEPYSAPILRTLTVEVA
ncbi:baseplate J/gp47 family protein [Roseovarius sp. D0-M9]|uniref:baseplate J/gp47 family protein n=1 Tax=Roseovarius sp. D0-M9 TaxID=3127117 RepID=UPI00300FE596